MRIRIFKYEMLLIKSLITTFILLLIAAFGSVAASAMPTGWQQVSHLDVVTQDKALGSDLAFAPRGPPFEAVKLTSTGASFTGAGDLRDLDGAATHRAFFDFDGKLFATNRTLTPELRDEIIATPHGQRPDPSTYMSQAEIDAHLARFDDGAVRIARASDVEEFGTAGPPNGGFVMPRSDFDNLGVQSRHLVDRI